MYTQYGVREICDVVFKAKANMTVGNRKFFKGEPVIYFDTLKTSTLEGAATTVYATGGRGNSRLIAWEGERTVTFTMEDALISPVGFMLLSGAGLIEAEAGQTKTVETTEPFDIKVEDENQKEFICDLKNLPINENIEVVGGYLAGGSVEPIIISVEDKKVTLYVEHDKTLVVGIQSLTGGIKYSYETFDTSNAKVIYQHIAETVSKDKYNEDDEFEVSEIVASQEQSNGALIYIMPLKNGKMFTEPYLGLGDGTSKKVAFAYIYTVIDGTETVNYQNEDWEEDFAAADAFLIDYYTPRYENAMQIDITADSFGGNFYIEASTLFRNTDGVDYPAEFIIPNAKIQSNFTFNMASSGDPSTFTFTCDAFPDYTRFNRTKKVIAALQVITAANSEDKYREATATSLSF